MKKRKQKKSLQTGQTLIEILLAFSVAILVLSAVVVGVSTSLSNTQYSKNQNLANSYVQEGMAIVRQIRDSNWSNFYEHTSVNYCLGQGLTTLDIRQGATCGQNIGIFAREVELTHDSGSCIFDENDPDNSIKGSKAVVTVLWADSKCPTGQDNRCHKAELISCFFNLDKRGEP